MNSRYLIGAGALLSATMLAPSAASAQDIDCRIVEAVGNRMSAELLEGVNANIDGFEQRVSRRKTLVVHRATAMSFDGCVAEIDLDVTLKRKIRRNARGRIVLRARVDRVNPNLLAPREVCFTDAKIDEIKLSKTLRIGERFYGLVANKAMPDNQCFAVA